MDFRLVTCSLYFDLFFNIPSLLCFLLGDVCSGCGILWTSSNFQFLFLSQRQCILQELGMMTLSVHTIVLSAWHGMVALNKEVPQTNSRNLPLLSMASHE